MQWRITIILCVLFCYNVHGQLTVSEVGSLVERVSNNAVCEGFIADQPYLFSFGGIDSTKRFSGIHQRSFRYNIETGESIAIPPLPDSRGKIASAASRIGNIIYITGGYYVNSDGSEVSSDKLHRYDILSNAYLPDGSPIPVPTDDHVQVVWRDSLLYLITGWHDSTNIPDVQIYDPENDTWLVGEAVPNNHDYKSFGASGVILNDTIFYFGGAASIFGFPIQNDLRKGVIDATDPTRIDWTLSTPDPLVVGYRMAATTVGKELHWIGGSERTYNFDGIAYNGTGGVPTANRDLFSTDGRSWSEQQLDLLPMDLRGIAVINDTLQYLAGGMLENQTVTNRVFRLEWQGKTSSDQDLSVSEEAPYLYPVPCMDRLFISGFSEAEKVDVEIYKADGQLAARKELVDGVLDVAAFPDGTYFIKVIAGTKNWTQKIIKSHGKE